MFGLFKKSESALLLDEITESYGMQYVTAYTTLVSHSACPKWWEGTSSGVRFTIRTFGKGHWEVTAGTILVLADIILKRAKEGKEFDSSSEGWLYDLLGPGGDRSARLYCIDMLPHNQTEFQGPQLDDDAFRIGHDRSA